MNDVVFGFEYHVGVEHPRDWPEPWHLLRCKNAAEKIGVSQQTFRLWAKDKDFPPMVSLGENSYRWLDLDLDKWIEWKSEQRKH